MNKILNLSYPDKSEIKFRVDKFPDGQNQISIVERTCSREMGVYKPLEIKSRLNNFQDLELIICATKSLRNLGIKEIHLNVPYFCGSRSDRQFEEGGNNYLKQVICPIINSLNFESVTTLKPHSDVLEACLNSFKKEDLSWKLVDCVIMDLLPDDAKLTDMCLISPDAGSYKWVNTIGREHGINVVPCFKERNVKTGEIISFQFTGVVEDKHCIILDDLIDGGKTFIEIAKYLKKMKAASIWLVIHHGIFSAGFAELSKYFDGIYCTNSYQDITTTGDVTTVYQSKFGAVSEENLIIRQLNVF